MVLSAVQAESNLHLNFLKMKSLNEMQTPAKHDLTKTDFAEKMKFFRSIFPNLKRDLAVLAGSVVLAGLAIGFSYSIRDQGATSCENCIEKLDDRPKVGHIVQARETLYGICESLGVPEECLSGCSRYIAGINGMNPDNPQLKEGAQIGIPIKYLKK